jgi:hypothetical protein
MARFEEQDDAHPFIVEWGRNDDEHELHHVFCATREEANSEADKLNARAKVWIGVYAHYELSPNRWSKKTVWIWWNSMTEWGTPPDKGYGVLDDNGRHRPYRLISN